MFNNSVVYLFILDTRNVILRTNLNHFIYLFFEGERDGILHKRVKKPKRIRKRKKPKYECLASETFQFFIFFFEKENSLQLPSHAYPQ